MKAVIDVARAHGLTISDDLSTTVIWQELVIMNANNANNNANANKSIDPEAWTGRKDTKNSSNLKSFLKGLFRGKQ